MRRREVKIDDQDVAAVEGPAIIERQSVRGEKSSLEWSMLTVNNMFLAAERALDEQDKVEK